MTNQEKYLAKNVLHSTVLALEEWYHSMMQGELSYLDKKHYNELMKPLNKYVKRLESSLNGGAEMYLEHNKDYLINCLQALYDEQLKIIKDERHD